MVDSILLATKKLLNLSADYTPFDEELIIYINAVFDTLHQLGVGPNAGFSITGPETLWSTYTLEDKRKDSVKTYMGLRVKLMFDTPSTSFAIAAIESQCRELEWRLNVLAEGAFDTPPTPSPDPDPGSGMSPEVYDPMGVHDDAFALGTHHGALDAGTYT